MKLKIEKLGRIQNAELDIRPLTVLIGPNNTNKTWTAYVLYGLLQHFSKRLGASQSPTVPSGDVESRFREILAPLFELLNSRSNSTRVALSVPADFLAGERFDSVSFNFEADDIGSTLGLTSEQMLGARARIEFSPAEFSKSDVGLDIAFERSLNRLQIRTNRRRRPSGGQIIESDTITILVREDWTEDAVLEALSREFLNLIGNVVVLPAERNGVLPVWPLMIESDRLGVPLPVKDFGRFLAVAQTSVPAGTTTATQTHLASLLRKVAGGEVAYVADADTRRLIFRSGSVEIPIHAAASLGRAVAGLSLYIERFFQPDDVLIIDELEMNAHPDAQVSLTEFVAALVNAGVRVVFTTHSPYVVDHLNNLMEASRVPQERQEELAGKFSLGTPSSFISPDRVSVYAFQETSHDSEVTVQDVLNRKTGLIDWSTFSRVSERITNLYTDILRATEGEA